MKHLTFLHQIFQHKNSLKKAQQNRSIAAPPGTKSAMLFQCVFTFG